jgi:putative FmdB family regulatory protein
MPIYEYRCSDCANYFEMIQKLSDQILTTCPQCGHNTLLKLISAAGFQLKGTGWYKTDFKSSPMPSLPAAETTSTTIDKPPTLT